MNWKKLQFVGEALRSAVTNTYHFSSVGARVPYVIWGEDGSNEELFADNKRIERLFTGTVDYFTANTEDPNLEKIEDAMTATGILHHLNSVQFEDETRLCHYEWTWEF